jgi:ATP-binding cassette subfamily B protein
VNETFFGVFRYSRRALELVWTTSRALTVALGLLTLVAGILPAGVAWVGALIVDAVVAAINQIPALREAALRHVIELVALEGVLVAAVAASQRGLSLCQSLLRAQLGQRVNVMILEKALTLDLVPVRGLRVLRQADAGAARGIEPAAVAGDAHFRSVQNAVSLVSFGVLLVKFSPWAVAVLLLAGLPAFIAEAKFSGDAFRLFRWRSPETRMQLYLETVIAREDHAKEVKLFGLGEPTARALSRDLHEALREDRS